MLGTVLNCTAVVVRHIAGQSFTTVHTYRTVGEMRGRGKDQNAPLLTTLMIPVNKGGRTWEAPGLKDILNAC